MDLTLDDLIGKCDACNGTGKKPLEKESGGGRTFGWSRTTITPFTGPPDECDMCIGTGHRSLTATGRAVVELFNIVKKYEARGLLGRLLHRGDDSSAM